jgi:cyclopropane fatty-acyl-phospholipid synthase-like methyltransferase
MTSDWCEYFDRLGGHSPLHRAQAVLYVRALCGVVGLRQDQRVLDFGCGFGFVAALVAPLVAEVWWWDISANMRSTTVRNVAGFPNARFCDVSALSVSASGGRTWHGPTFDIILINSVAQYMAPEELRDWLPRWAAMLAPNGQLVLSDLISPHHSNLSDIAHLLRLGLEHGSPVRAVSEALGGVANYWRTRRTLSLTSLSRADLAGQAAAAGLDVTFLPANLTHFRKRWAAVLRPRCC